MVKGEDMIEISKSIINLPNDSEKLIYSGRQYNNN